jgi:hypothetical protein
VFLKTAKSASRCRFGSAIDVLGARAIEALTSHTHYSLHGRALNGDLSGTAASGGGILDIA